jgi:hypothetical protein
MEPLTLLHRFEIERRERPAHRHLVEARRARSAVRRARVRQLVRATSARPTSAAQPCGC